MTEVFTKYLLFTTCLNNCSDSCIRFCKKRTSLCTFQFLYRCVILQKHLIELWQRCDVDQSLRVVKTVDPLLPLGSLSSDVKHSELLSLDHKLHFDHPHRRNPCVQNVVFRWNIMRFSNPWQGIKEAEQFIRATVIFRNSLFGGVMQVEQFPLFVHTLHSFVGPQLYQCPGNILLDLVSQSFRRTCTLCRWTERTRPFLLVSLESACHVPENTFLCSTNCSFQRLSNCFCFRYITYVTYPIREVDPELFHPV